MLLAVFLPFLCSARPACAQPKRLCALLLLAPTLPCVARSTASLAVAGARESQISAALQSKSREHQRRKTEAHREIKMNKRPIESNQKSRRAQEGGKGLFPMNPRYKFSNLHLQSLTLGEKRGRVRTGTGRRDEKPAKEEQIDPPIILSYRLY